MTNSTKLTGLWQKKDKAGKSYFTGSLTGTARLVIFPNGYKQKDSDPDYIAYIVPAERPHERASVGGTGKGNVRDQTAAI